MTANICIDAIRRNLQKIITLKKQEIGQRDSVGIEIYSAKVARQKLGYLHHNPVNGKWQLAKDYLSYHYSSARSYETGIDEFVFLCLNLY